MDLLLTELEKTVGGSKFGWEIGHVKFEMPFRHLNGAVEQDVGYLSLGFWREELAGGTDESSQSTHI